MDSLTILRRKAGISQKDLAKKSGIPATLLSKIENGRVNPSLEELSWMAPVLGVSTEELAASFAARGIPLWRPKWDAEPSAEEIRRRVAQRR